MCSFKLKKIMYQNRFWPGLHSGSRCESLRRSPRAPKRQERRTSSPYLDTFAVSRSPKGIKTALDVSGYTKLTGIASQGPYRT